MNLTIKKADSVTSILLFIFNVFISEQGTTEIPLKTILKLLEPFQKSETAVRMGLSRGLQSGFLVNIKKNSEVYYKLTDEALKTFQYWWKNMHKFQEQVPLQYNKWDSTWNMVHMNGNSIDAFFESLKQLGYGSLKKYLWISPYDSSDKVIKLIREYGLEDSVFMFQSRLVETSKTQKLVRETWPVTDLAKRYKKYVAEFNQATRNLNAKSHYGGEGLPFLHRYGLKLFEIIKDDPQLPLELLPSNWSGIQAFESFINMREEILPDSKKYINSVLTS